jgi:hypothetical protein
MYYMLACEVPVIGTGAIVADNPEIDNIYDKYIKLITNLLNATEINWKHAYFWPDDNYYAYIFSTLNLNELRDKFYGFATVAIISADKKSHKYGKINGESKSLTVAEYMQ